MKSVRVNGSVGGFVRSSEADQVGHDAAIAGCDERRDHLSREIEPRRLPAQKQDGLAVARPFVEVMHAIAANVVIVRRESELGQMGKSLVGRTQDSGSHFLTSRRTDRLGLRWDLSNTIIDLPR